MPVYAADGETVVTASEGGTAVFGESGTEVPNSEEDTLSEGTSVEADNIEESESENNTNISDYSAVYEDGKIKIYTLEQLEAIGSGKPVMSNDNAEGQFGTGEAVTADQIQITYSLDAQYELMNPITLNADNIWTLPDGFAGTFFGGAVDESAPLYDKITDTIYIYNNYQLQVICSERADQEPVMSNDMFAAKFGMGQLVYPNGTPTDDSEEAVQGYLTYSREHNYVLATGFTAEMPKIEAVKAGEDILWLDEEQADGRTQPGQLYYEINGEKYILIGNEMQLRAIGSNKHVTPRMFIYNEPGLVGGLLGADPSYIPYYPGDADLGLESVVNESSTTHHKLITGDVMDEVKVDEGYTYYGDNCEEKRYQLADVDLSDDGLLEDILGIVGGLLGGLLTGTNEFCGVDETGRPNHESMGLSELKKIYGDLRYSSDANYIIFRNIDLSESGENSNGVTDDWQPVNISGNIEGRLDMQDGQAVTISNINVYQTGKINPSTTRGLGFFGSISNRTDEAKLGSSAGTTLVEDIHLSNVNIKNESTEVEDVTNSLVEGLVGLLSGVLGGLLGIVDDLLGWIIPDLGNLNLGDVVKSLLEVQKNSLDIFAAGSFAGRVIGDVKIQNCTVSNAVVTSVKGMTGGLVGYTEGTAEYDLLSNVGGTTVKLLANLLNLIPGLGLGDLITVLLENDISIGELIPIGYYKPQIIGCSVTLEQDVFGSTATDYNGGFAGMQIAANISGCSVSGVVSVQAGTGAGGFAGIERDAVIDSLLSSLGVELSTFDIKSEQNNCSVIGQDIQVLAQAQYAGGFNGVMTNSISRGCKVESLNEVRAEKYAGGFAGRATIGYGTTIGDGDEKDNTLLESVSKLLTQLVAPGNEDKLNTLLSLTGLTPSEIYGCTVSGTTWSVETSSDYAGGLIGQGDGVKIEANGEEGNQITGISSVKAENYAGGISGSITTANPIGVLNTTIGVGSYLPFSLVNTTVSGNNLTVQAGKKYAAGGVGLVLGGTVNQVSVTGLADISARNYAGGFAGRAGTGGLAETQGLDLLGLGLIKIDNLLSVVQGVAVEISDTHVTGMEQGFSIFSSGEVEAADGESILSGGFIAEAVGIKIENSDVTRLKEAKVQKQEGKNSYAGGFAGRSHTGGLAGLAKEEEDGSLKLPGLVSLDSPLDLLPYLLPKYTNCKVKFVSNEGSTQVEAQYAGGFFGAMQSGEVDNSSSEEPYAVYGLESVRGEAYAGGFAGKADAGAAASSDGLKLLDGLIDLNIGGLVSVLNVYVPEITSAGVKSNDNGFVVEATAQDSSAGGYIGYGSGVQIKDSDVLSLKHTEVTPPSDNLESANGENYFNENSEYAVKGGKYAGGYIGCADIDSAAGVGAGLELLNSISLSNVLEALDIVAAKIENSDVSGCVGGFSVLADGKDADGNVIGKSGGFVGESSGTQIKNSNVLNFAYIIGRETAGGFSGLLEPGDVASVLEDGSILSGIVNIEDNLASLVQSFIPIVEDCQTSSVPCGGAVRADGYSDSTISRGIAGGYVGYNHGGRIQGNTKECSVIRLRSVYGGEFAGGFTGLMENADLASTGNISLLFGLVETSNVLSLLGAVYPTETNTAVYGPLRNLDMNTWNAWVEAVGKNGVYGSQLPSNPVGSEEELQELIRSYAYGYNVKAGRTQVGSLVQQAGVAGGYVGRMQGGVVTEAHAWDAKDISAYESAGGFAGEMFTGGVAEVGSVSLLGLDITGSLNAVQTFVPVIRNSDITGYQSGMYVKATGIPNPSDRDKVGKVGYAGGFAGHMIGGQIWGNWTNEKGRSATDAVPDSNNNRCFTANLRRVDGTNAVGGFAGLIDPGSAAALDTSGSSGLLGGLLQHAIGTPGDLLSLLNTTLSTVRAADVKAWDDWGILINGVYSDGSVNIGYANAAGGFAGEINGAVIGENADEDAGIHVENIRSVTGGEHVGGFFGLADVSAAAEITGAGDTSILGSLLTLGSTDVLDAFRTYIYNSTVSGAKEAGLEVNAREGKKTEFENNAVYTGNAGGFGGTLLNGSVKESGVTNLREVNGLNYTGGFIGHLGKSGTVDIDKLGILDNLLGVGAGILDIFGSHVEDSYVTGMAEGFTVRSQNTAEEKSEIAGGFAGYADLAKLDNNQVTNLKQVASEETAGGFAGQTSFAYLADIEADSPLVNGLFDVLAEVLKLLHLGELEQGDLIHVGLIVVKVDLFTDGNLIQLDVLGLKVKISLDQNIGEDYELVTVEIGDSKIEMKCDGDGNILDSTEVENEIEISLIKANRTRIDGCSVKGIADGYDVYGGGAGNDVNGSGDHGYAGGFVGWNNEGLLKNNQMYLADVIRGTKGITGPFTGSSSLESNWDFNTLFGIEGENNQYRIYRDFAPTYNKVLSSRGQELQSGFETDSLWNIYTITHMESGKVEKFSDLKNAVMSDGFEENKLDAYMEDGAMAVLMKNSPTEPTQPGGDDEAPDVQDPCKDTVELRIKKVWKNDREKDRPEQITLHITRTYESDGQVVNDDNFIQEIIMSKEDYQSEDTWEKILSGTPYTTYYLGADGTKHYYTYYVSEDVLDGYKTKITYRGDYQYSITITNEKTWFDSLLPDTGGAGTLLLYVIAFVLITGLVLSYRKKQRE